MGDKEKKHCDSHRSAFNIHKIKFNMANVATATLFMLTII
jgi:hypothetical protein